ncbi:MAG: TonB-dependent receptor [Candidatus Brocadia sp. AMX2]|uniref:Iron complex outermembrane recepter protein n=1 Tax=Candidatus Brocadia sinica JPN1 TaxID=1197129 RepID=A0ABQ0K2T1_9BACT|nr:MULTISPECIES: TonB-dependent receptor [Brocadia]MBC6932312.1 TonB-dependent receptor [Candidatus Brocadia sp.]MBL1169808.1 TonB-dependent receptor [Candidatus Brocadia sp. AMX1]NOG40356.1 TonB-dependent receptor [Planctomycetota bacterium]GIK14870.1 MAG: hypothetical protein BroJett002_35770 [Candidatus Brocadia sinica]KAA0245070.1 MAG: TonB-dependent receptor [Candidatus Brocadia sp. AMX2]
MTKCLTHGLTQSLLALYLFLLSCISFHSSEIFAEDISTSRIETKKTTQSTEILSNDKEKHSRNMKVALAEGISTKAIWFGFEQEVTIATRHETPVGKAPSIVTVITAKEIKHLGYRTFVEILRTVPGFEILKKGDLGEVFPAVRGFAGSEKVRVMLNGHLVNSPRTGSAFQQFDDFPVENIERIEIIRGPGSAVYGENAFLAVINIITFDAKDIDGIKVSGGYGSFDTEEGNIVFGKTYGKVDISGMVRYRHTDGFDGIVESDIVTQIDTALASLGFPPSSQAQGRVEDWREEYDLNLKVVYKGFYVEGLYINKNMGPFIGPQFALADESNIEQNYVFGEAGYRNTFDEKFTIRPRLYYDQFDRNSYIEALPENAHVPLDTDGDGVIDKINTYPDGLIGNAYIKERVVGTEVPFDYKIFDGNIITLGFEYRLIGQTNPHFFTTYNPRTLDPLDSLQDQADTYPFIKEATRRIWSVYLQDAWDITDTLNLTLGVRHDEYSDFGNTTSPRAGLTGHS